MQAESFQKRSAYAYRGYYTPYPKIAIGDSFTPAPNTPGCGKNGR